MSNNDNELWSKLHQQNVQHMRARQEWERITLEVEMVLAEAETVTNFRRRFNRWLKTEEGQAVKQKLLIIQEGKCFHCNLPLQIPDGSGGFVNHSEVHHLAPLTLLQRYAKAHSFIEIASLLDFVTSIKYIRLVHPLCNKKLGEKIGDLEELSFLKEFLEENQ